MSIDFSEIADIAMKVKQGSRLTYNDGIRLYRSNNILALGYLANNIRERLHGDQTFFIVNRHINYTNICQNECQFCAYYRSSPQKDAYTMSLKEILEAAEEHIHTGISELHIVGGVNPEISYSYYIDMIQGLHQCYPNVHLQAFTMVEIDQIAKTGGKTVKDALIDLKNAGLGSLPGGGAEIFSGSIREALCPKKISGERWLEIAKQAHQLGIHSNATMLYGHIESIEQRVDHLLKLRELQDDTAGFLSFIPLAFHPENTKVQQSQGTTGFDDLKNLSIARIMLDNFPHIKAFWIMVGPKIAQVSLHFGVDDLDGTVIEEKITHAAGAKTSQGMTRSELIHLIREAGRIPVERDTLYKIRKIEG